MKSGVRLSNLAMNICGDFLQLPPVEKQKGSRRSLAMPLDHHGRCDAQEATPDNEVHHDRSVASRLAEARQGFELWRSITRVVCLTVNVRAPGVLSRLQAEMRSGAISDDMWNLYMGRVLQPGDLRLQDPSLPFCNNEIHFIVHKHRIRTMRSMDHAKEYCILHQQPHPAAEGPEEQNKRPVPDLGYNQNR